MISVLDSKIVKLFPVSLIFAALLFGCVPVTEPATTAVDTVEPTAEPVAEDAAPADESADSGDAGSLCVEGVLDCGSVTVPVDYADASLGTLEIQYIIHRATSPEERIGYLFINPGGPGLSAITYAATASLGPGFSFTGEVIERFDLVGMDPRGVEGSEPAFACGVGDAQRALLNQIDGRVDTDEETALSQQAADLCVESMGSAAMRLGTEFVARDMDEVRKALGVDQISYFGASYGSTLGVWYATLFPDNVRAMVIDAADNPVEDRSSQEARLEDSFVENVKFEELLNEALAACDTPECPIYNDGDPTSFFKDHVADLDLVNEAFDGHPLAGTLAVITPLYSSERWPVLWEGLAAIAQGDPQVLIDQAATQLGEASGPSFNGHVNCLDEWSLYPELDRETSRSDSLAFDAAAPERLPLLSLMPMSAPGACSYFEAILPAPLGQPLNGSGVPILVIGNQSDPATPFSESLELAESTLTDGFLVEVDEPQHTVYPGNACVNELIHNVLIDLSYPTEQRTQCESAAPQSDLEVTLEEIRRMCSEGAVEGTDPATLETACNAFMAQVQETYTSEQLAVPLLSMGVEMLNGFVDMIISIFAEAGIEMVQ